MPLCLNRQKSYRLHYLFLFLSNFLSLFHFISFHLSLISKVNNHSIIFLSESICLLYFNQWLRHAHTNIYSQIIILHIYKIWNFGDFFSLYFFLIFQWNSLEWPVAQCLFEIYIFIVLCVHLNDRLWAEFMFSLEKKSIIRNLNFYY